MSDDVTELWWPDNPFGIVRTDSSARGTGTPDDIRLVTDTDLQAKRYARGKLSDPTDYSARLVETARRTQGLNTTSATIDRGLRVQLAHLIDSREVLFSRDDYDVSYLIPPPSWVNEHRFDHHDLVSRADLPEDLDPEERSISFTTPDVVYEMLQDATKQTEYETLSDLIRGGVERLIGDQ